MPKSVFVLIKCDYDEGYPFNDPSGPFETRTIFGVCSSEQLADEACKAQANRLFEMYGSSESVEKGTNGYGFDTDNGWICCFYEAFELDKNC